VRRARTFLLCAVVTLGLAAPATAEAAAEGKVTVRSKIASFSAVNGRLVANGTVTGKLSRGGEALRDTARVRFRALQQNGSRCDILTLRMPR
jgi:hypothetical protein